jgi:hypothetical protein
MGAQEVTLWQARLSLASTMLSAQNLPQQRRHGEYMKSAQTVNSAKRLIVQYFNLDVGGVSSRKTTRHPIARGHELCGEGCIIPLLSS